MKQKKKLSDNQRFARNKKIKHVIKIVLDVLIYGFAFFMCIGLILGSCSVGKRENKNSVKTEVPNISRVFYGTSTYFNLFDIDISNGREYQLFYPFSSKLNKMIPNYSMHIEELNYYSTDSSTTRPMVRLNQNFNLEDNVYQYLAVYLNGSNGIIRYQLAYYSQGEPVFLPFLTINRYNVVDVLRADVFTRLFGGSFKISVANASDIPSNDSAKLMRFLVFNYSTEGYNNIKLDMPINPVAYLDYFTSQLTSTDLLTPFFRNVNLPQVDITNVGNYINPSATNISVSYSVPVFVGHFYCANVYYNEIYFNFRSFYGRDIIEYRIDDTTSNHPYRRYYVGGAEPSYYSDNQYYSDYYYLDSISYRNDDNDIIVWTCFDKSLVYEAPNEAYLDCQYNPHWVGDTYLTGSEFRSLFIYSILTGTHTSSALYPFADNFPGLEEFDYVSFLNLIGSAYPNTYSPTTITGISGDLFSSVFGWLRGALSGLMPTLSYSLLPGITIGTLIMIPFTMTIILFVIGLFKR